MAKKTDFLAKQNSGFLQDLAFQLKLLWRLMKDNRVNFLLKLLPVGALIYLVSPVDLIPGAVLPVVGALDDAAVLWLGFTLFVSLCPEEVVREHTNALQHVITGTWREASENEGDDKALEVDSGEIHPDEQ
jgi:uncharacterized membrane protein YkvA (DUF1232 family)